MRTSLHRKPKKSRLPFGLVGFTLGMADLAGRYFLDVLTRWQATVLGVPEVGYRTGTAFAKGGRERYALDPAPWT